jgi:hypothetical protein
MVLKFVSPCFVKRPDIEPSGKLKSRRSLLHSKKLGRNETSEGDVSLDFGVPSGLAHDLQSLSVVF